MNCKKSELRENVIKGFNISSHRSKWGHFGVWNIEKGSQQSAAKAASPFLHPTPWNLELVFGDKQQRDWWVFTPSCGSRSPLVYSLLSIWWNNASHLISHYHHFILVTEWRESEFRDMFDDFCPWSAGHESVPGRDYWPKVCLNFFIINKSEKKYTLGPNKLRVSSAITLGFSFDYVSWKLECVCKVNRYSYDQKSNVDMWLCRECTQRCQLFRPSTSESLDFSTI